MGLNFHDYLREAYRLLKYGGWLKIAIPTLNRIHEQTPPIWRTGEPRRLPNVCETVQTRDRSPVFWAGWGPRTKNPFGVIGHVRERPSQGKEGLP